MRLFNRGAAAIRTGTPFLDIAHHICYSDLPPFFQRLSLSPRLATHYPVPHCPPLDITTLALISRFAYSTPHACVVQAFQMQPAGTAMGETAYGVDNDDVYVWYTNLYPKKIQMGRNCLSPPPT